MTCIDIDYYKLFGMTLSKLVVASLLDKDAALLRLSWKLNPRQTCFSVK